MMKVEIVKLLVLSKSTGSNGSKIIDGDHGSSGIARPGQIHKIVQFARPADDINEVHLLAYLVGISLSEATDKCNQSRPAFLLSKVMPMTYPADGFVFGVSADRTRIQHRKIRLVRLINRNEPGSDKSTRDQFAVEFVHLAAEGFEVKCLYCRWRHRWRRHSDCRHWPAPQRQADNPRYGFLCYILINLGCRRPYP
jgi:hypothetical protein